MFNVKLVRFVYHVIITIFLIRLRNYASPVLQIVYFVIIQPIVKAVMFICLLSMAYVRPVKSLIV